MLPTTTPTTTLFLPDSRARMRGQGAGKQGKEQNRRVKSKAFWRHSSMMWLPPPPPHPPQDPDAVLFLFFFNGYVLRLGTGVSRFSRQRTMRCRCHKQKGKEKGKHFLSIIRSLINKILYFTASHSLPLQRDITRSSQTSFTCTTEEEHYNRNTLTICSRWWYNLFFFFLQK